MERTNIHYVVGTLVGCFCTYGSNSARFSRIAINHIDSSKQRLVSGMSSAFAVSGPYVHSVDVPLFIYWHMRMDNALIRFFASEGKDSDEHRR